MIRHASRVQRLERDLEAAVDAALGPWRPKLDAAEAAARGAWGEAVRARGLSYLAALDANDPPVPDGVDPLVLGYYLEAAAEASARKDRTPPRVLVEAHLLEMDAYCRSLTDEQLLDAINKHPCHQPAPEEHQP